MPSQSVIGKTNIRSYIVFLWLIFLVQDLGSLSEDGNIIQGYKHI